MTEALDHLWQTIESRKKQRPVGSYTVELLTAGVPRIARKVGEEAVETAVAALSEGKVGEEAVETAVAALSEGDERLISEMADLFYHCLVLLSARDLSLDDLQAELARRFSGSNSGSK
jgi:phosphoribosyl-ATP pyrophosphohydrolase